MHSFVYGNWHNPMQFKDTLTNDQIEYGNEMKESGIQKIQT